MSCEYGSASRSFTVNCYHGALEQIAARRPPETKMGCMRKNSTMDRKKGHRKKIITPSRLAPVPVCGVLYMHRRMCLADERRRLGDLVQLFSSCTLSKKQRIEKRLTVWSRWFALRLPDAQDEDRVIAFHNMPPLKKGVKAWCCSTI